jgi:hypothetical protein
MGFLKAFECGGKNMKKVGVDLYPSSTTLLMIYIDVDEY